MALDESDLTGLRRISPDPSFRRGWVTITNGRSYLLLRLPITGPESRWISTLGLLGMLMPAGILAEIVLGAPPLFVLIGGVSMTVSVAWLGLAVSRMRDVTSPVSREGT